jgi:hypothetical protein
MVLTRDDPKTKEKAMTNDLLGLSSAQLRQAIRIKEQIESLERELGSALGTAPATRPPKTARRSKMSASARARISAAQKARWAKARRGKSGKANSKPRRKANAAARKRLSQLAKARWAKAKAAGRKSL